MGEEELGSHSHMYLCVCTHKGGHTHIWAEGSSPVLGGSWAHLDHFLPLELRMIWIFWMLALPCLFYVCWLLAFSCGLKQPASVSFLILSLPLLNYAFTTSPSLLPCKIIPCDIAFQSKRNKTSCLLLCFCVNSLSLSFVPGLRGMQLILEYFSCTGLIF